mmetsp:Transcript_28010/g.42929  ORF Transcript_28010/g.42929 Transcript_28010/m.42929 type:complete len:231 (+) Transcript_28010:2454-3146(+)
MAVVILVFTSGIFAFVLSNSSVKASTSRERYSCSAMMRLFSASKELQPNSKSLIFLCNSDKFTMDCFLPISASWSFSSKLYFSFTIFSFSISLFLIIFCILTVSIITSVLIMLVVFTISRNFTTSSSRAIDFSLNESDFICSSRNLSLCSSIFESIAFVSLPSSSLTFTSLSASSSFFLLASLKLSSTTCILELRCFLSRSRPVFCALVLLRSLCSFSTVLSTFFLSAIK